MPDFKKKSAIYQKFIFDPAGKFVRILTKISGLRLTFSYKQEYGAPNGRNRFKFTAKALWGGYCLVSGENYLPCGFGK